MGRETSAARTFSPQSFEIARAAAKMPVNPPRVLCLNRGSSSLKLALFELGARERRLATGAVERIGVARGKLRLRDEASGQVTELPGDINDAHAAVALVFRALEGMGFGAPAAVGHRLVHGGIEHSAPRLIDPSLLAELRRLVPFAPLHLPPEIEVIEAVSTGAPRMPQVACFDTAFHRRMPEVAQRLPLRRSLWDEGVRRYGFHGLSYESIVDSVEAASVGRSIIAHLGNGASLAALAEGKPLDTTMAFTPTAGCMMGTRSGDLDPGVLLHMVERRGFDAAALDRLINHDAGLLGVSGITSDMQALLEKRRTDPRAALAVEMFCYSVRKHVGALAAVLGGLDALIFTGGIGEHAAAVRAEICQGLAHLGIRIDPRRNQEHARRIGEAGGATVWVVPTDEERMIARHSGRVLEL
jgi:acetate kinase